MSPAPARIDELKKRYEENPRRFFAPLANEYRKAGDLASAIDLCRLHLAEQPGHLSGHIVYGQALYESSRSAEARTAFEAALTLDPENLIALRHLGDIACFNGEAADATRWYQRVLDADPRNDEVIALIQNLQAEPSAAGAEESEPSAVKPPAVAPSAAAPSAPPVIVESDFPFGSRPTVDPRAPTPVIPVDAVPRPSAASPRAAPTDARQSLGLTGVDLNFTDAAVPAADFIGEGDLPYAESPAPDVEELAEAFEEGFPLIDTTYPAVADAGPELLGADDDHLGLAAPDAPMEMHDASFDLGLAVADDSTFPSLQHEPALGGDLDFPALADLDIEQSLPALDGIDAHVEAADEALEQPLAPSLERSIELSVVPDEPALEPPLESALEPPLEPAPDDTPPPSPFVTETMADLYMRQGFREEALGVYRQLLAQNPGDAALALHLRNLELGSPSLLPVDRVSREMEVVVLGGDVAHRESPSTEQAEQAEQPEQAEQAEQVEQVVQVESTDSAQRSVPAPTTPTRTPSSPTPAGLTARAFLAGIARRRVIRGGQPAPAIASVAGGGGIDRLFSGGGVGDADERAASAIAAAFADAPAVPIVGEPTREGVDELSLDSVFKGDDAPRPAVQRQSTKLRFDQFFSEVDPSASSASTVPAPVPQASGTGEDDIAQFNTWLKGLKGS